MADVDVKQIKVTGPGLKGGQTGQRCSIYVSGAHSNVLEDGLTYGVSGSGVKHDVMADYKMSNEEGKVEIYYIPIVPGDFKITIRFKGRHVEGSPFISKVEGIPIDAEKILSKVSVHGTAYDFGKAFTTNEFVVDCSRVKPVIGDLKVHIKGPQRSSAQLNLVDNQNGTYTVQYKPSSVGVYTMTIRIAETHIPGSPHEIKVTEFLSK